MSLILLYVLFSLIFPMRDYLSVFTSSQVTWRAQNWPIDRYKMDLMSAPHFHLREGVRGSDLNGWKFILLNGSSLVVHLRSYNNKDLKCHMRIWNVGSRSDDWDLAMLSLHTITWCDLDAQMKIQGSQLNHNDSPIWTLSRLLTSWRRRSDSHAQF